MGRPTTLGDLRMTQEDSPGTGEKDAKTLAFRFGDTEVVMRARTAVFTGLLLLVGGGGLGYRNDLLPTIGVDDGWKKSIDAHVKDSDRGYRRLTVLEDWAARFELRFLQQCRWEALRAGDRRRADELEGEIALLRVRPLKGDR